MTFIRLSTLNHDLNGRYLIPEVLYPFPLLPAWTPSGGTHVDSVHTDSQVVQALQTLLLVPDTNTRLLRKTISVTYDNHLSLLTLSRITLCQIYYTVFLLGSFVYYMSMYTTGAPLPYTQFLFARQLLPSSRYTAVCILSGTSTLFAIWAIEWSIISTLLQVYFVRHVFRIDWPYSHR